MRLAFYISLLVGLFILPGCVNGYRTRSHPSPNLPKCQRQSQYCNSSRIDPGKKLYRGFVSGMPLTGSVVLCDGEIDGGGWIVFQRRWNSSFNFNRKWSEYKSGFESNDGDFWWGNENLYLFTSQRNCELYVIVISGNETFHEQYTKFRISSEKTDYELHYDTRTQRTGLKKLDALAYVNGQTFSTNDKGWDREKCAKKEEGGWWYYDRYKCTDSMLNGKEMFWGKSPIKYSQMMVRCYPDSGSIPGLPVCHRQELYDCSSSCIDPDKKLYRGIAKAMSVSRSEVLCDGKTDSGGWVVFQRRWNGTLDYNRGWEQYKNGFGSIDDEFWWGNENLHLFTKNKNCELYIIVISGNETFEERYTKFWINTENSGYELHYDTRTQRTGLKKLDALAYVNGQTFSTNDKGWDHEKCAKKEEGGWWYYDRHRCTDSMLNGKKMVWGKSKVEYSQMMVRCYPENGPIRGLPVCHRQKEYDCSFFPCIDLGKKLYRSIDKRMPIERSEVLCDGKTFGGGWIVFQRRWKAVANFTRGWKQYKNGFGSIDDEFWWGNENLHLFTKQGTCELYVIVISDNESFHERYTKFRIDSEAVDYKLSYDYRTEEIGFKDLDALAVSKGETFSTNDHGYDKTCAKEKEGGWWYRNSWRCTDSMLNGKTLSWGSSPIRYSQMMVRCFPSHERGPIPGLPICHKDEPYDCGSLCIDPDNNLFRGSDEWMSISRSEVLCDGKTDGGGWVVFQRRWNFTVDFNRGWEQYKNGFGNINGEFWWGNENLYLFTKQRTCELFIIMISLKGRFKARYSKFRIGPENTGYKLSYDDNIFWNGARHLDAFAVSNGQTFSTNDHGYDRELCAKKLKGGWWYYDRYKCTDSTLNGKPVFWGELKGDFLPIEYSQMMVRCQERIARKK